MSIVLNGNTALATITSGGNTLLGYGTATEVLENNWYIYTHTITDTQIALNGGPGPYRFNVDDNIHWSINLLSSGSTVIDVDVTVAQTTTPPIMVHTLQMHCVAGNGVMQITNGKFIIQSRQSNSAYTNHGVRTVTTINPPGLFNLGQQSTWNPSLPTGKASYGVGCYYDSSRNTLCFVDCIPVYLKPRAVGYMAFYFHSWEPFDNVELQPSQLSGGLDVWYNPETNAYELDLTDSTIMGYVDLAIAPLVPPQVLLRSSTAALATSNRTALYTVPPRTMTIFNGSPAVSTMGFDVLSGTVVTLLTPSNSTSILSTTDQELLKKSSNNPPTQFFYNLSSAVSGDDFVASFGYSTSTDWGTYTGILDSMVNGGQASPSDPIKVQCIKTKISI